MSYTYACDDCGREVTDARPHEHTNCYTTPVTGGRAPFDQYSVPDTEVSK